MFRDNPDGTASVYLPEIENLQSTVLPQTPIPTPYMLDDLSAVQTAIATILSSITMYSIDRKALLEGRAEVGRMKIRKIFYDTPRAEDDLEFPAACISTNGETTFDIADTNFQQLDEDTLNQYGAGTIVQKLGYSATPIQVVLWFGNKDDRAGGRKALMEFFAGEPFDERPGRRVVMPYYYYRIASIDLLTITYMDDPDKAKANEFPLVMNFDTMTEFVRLVAAPGVLQNPAYAISNLADD